MTIISALPYNLQNGNNADASQVMANFNQIRNDVNNNIPVLPGTVTSITAGTGLSGGTITNSGTISIADGTINSLMGYNNAGAFSDITIGTNLTLSGGVLNASGATVLTDLMDAHTTSDSIFLGSGVGSAVTVGNNNTAVGEGSLQSLTTGSNITAIGHNVLSSFDNINDYTVVGASNFAGNVGTGNGNTVVGATTSNGGDSQNTIIGAGALVGTGTAVIGSTVIGYGAHASNGCSNSIALGNLVTVNAPNTVRIGNSSVTSVTFGNPSTTILHANGSFLTGMDNQITTITTPTIINSAAYLQLSVGGNIYNVALATPGT